MLFRAASPVSRGSPRYSGSESEGDVSEDERSAAESSESEGERRSEPGSGSEDDEEEDEYPKSDAAESEPEGNSRSDRTDRKSTRLNYSHSCAHRMQSAA